jgi:hypothetical protein
MGSGKLTKEELTATSGMARDSAQERWLRAEGIPFRRNARGELVVLWTHVTAWVEGRPSVRFSEPDFSSLRT